MVGVESLRQRISFKFSEDSPDEALDENQVLDEQEQEELIGNIRDRNAESNQKLLLVLQATLVLSTLLHIIYLFMSSRGSPLLAIFPRTPPDPPLPLATVFTLLALVIHLNLAALVHAEYLRRVASNIQLIPHPISYGLSAVAPCLCVFLGRSWQTILWWSLTGIIVHIVQVVERSIVSSNNALAELERLRYVARGA